MEFAHFVAKALIVIFCVMHESSQNNVSWLFKRNKIITWFFVLNLIPSNIFWNIWMIYWPCQAWIELSLLLTLLSISIISLDLWDVYSCEFLPVLHDWNNVCVSFECRQNNIVTCMIFLQFEYMSLIMLWYT